VLLLGCGAGREEGAGQAASGSRPKGEGKKENGKRIRYFYFKMILTIFAKHF